MPKGKREVGNFCGSDYIPTQNTAELIFELAYKRILQVRDLESDQKLSEVLKSSTIVIFMLSFLQSESVSWGACNQKAHIKWLLKTVKLKAIQAYM